MSTTDTERDERLRGIQERVNAATEGPWVETYPQSRTIVSEPDDQIVVDSFNDGIGAGVLGRTDALFIAAARTDVPWLLAEVARLDAVVTAVQDEVESWVTYPGHTAEAQYFRRYLGDRIRRALDGGAR